LNIVAIIYDIMPSMSRFDSCVNNIYFLFLFIPGICLYIYRVVLQKMVLMFLELKVS